MKSSVSILHVASAFAFAASLSTPVFAQSVEADSTLANEQDSIIVTATRMEQEVWKTGQAVSVIDRKEIEESQDVRVTDLLRRVPGITISSTGGLGQQASVFVRGADNAQTLVLVDGVRLNDPSDVGGGFDYGSLLTGGFDRVEILRGSQSAVWGSQAIGGVINFRTPEPGKEWTGRASAEYGARDFVNLTGATSGSVGPVGLSFGAQYIDTDGYSALSEERGFDERDGFEGYSLFGKATLMLTERLSVNAGGYLSDNDYEFDDSFTPADAPNKGEKRDLTGFGFVEYRDDLIDGRLGYTLTDTDRRSYTVSSSGPYEINYDGRREFVEAVVTVRPLSSLAFTVGGESEKSEFFDDAGSSEKTGIDSLFGQINVTQGEWLSVNGGIRYDDHEDFGDETSLSASAAIRPFSNGLTLRASYGEGFRAPSLYQNYYNGAYGGSEIDAETAKSYDVGLSIPFDDGRGAFQTTYFNRKTRNLIAFDYVSGYFNIGKAKAEGLEFAFDYKMRDIDVRLSYTYMDAEDETSGLDLPRRPKNNFFAGISYRPIDRLLIGADITHGERRFDDAANVTVIGDYTALDLRASYDLTNYLTFYGRVENVTDTEYELATNYGQPGRNATVGVRASF